MNPPRWAELLLTLCLPPGLTGASILGDMAEHFDARVRDNGLRAARRWYVRQALNVAASFIRRDTLRFFSPGGSPVVHLLTQSIRSGLRSIRRTPGFTATTVLILALGIGATSTVFSIVDGVLLQPLPYPDADALYTIDYVDDGGRIPVVSEPEFHDISSEIGAFESTAAYAWTEGSIGSTAEPERIALLLVTASLGPVLGLQPAAGRWFSADEDQPDGSPVALLSFETATRVYGSPSEAVGADVLIDDEPRTVVGVLPRGLRFESDEIQAWIPLGLDPVDPFGRNNHYLETVVRLAPNATAPTAASQLEALASAARREFPATYGDRFELVPVPLKERVAGSARAPLVLLLSAVVGLLLVAATNAAGLFLARGERRRAEIAVRGALGASRAQIFLHLLAEAVVVSLLAAAAGLLLAYLAVGSIGAWTGAALPRLNEVSVDGRAVLFGLLVALVTGLLFGLLPALQAGRSDVRSALAGGGRGGLGSRRDTRFRRSLVVGQLALASVLVLGTTLMTRSLASLRSVDLGMDLTSTWVVPVLPTRTAVPRDAPAILFYGELERRVRELPGVRAVGSARRIPLLSGHDRLSIQIEDRQVVEISDAPVAGIQWATASYFGAVGIPVIEGRVYADDDDVAAPLVTVVNEALARELWPGESALGKQVRMWPEDSPWMEVVGVVADVRRNGPQEAAPSMLYVPHAQALLSGYYAPNDLSLFVRVDEAAPDVVPAIREIIREAAPSAPMGTVRSGEELTRRAVARDQFLVGLLSAFAASALLLGAVGVYGVISQTMRTRTREMGLRVAMGASATEVGREVLIDGLRVGVLGGILGLAGGGLLTARISDSVLHVSPLDPIAYALVLPTLVIIVLAATVLPAVSAARMDPVQALRDRS